eukprot:TRINITY_DN3383_c0_g2_i1.p1 TRINITY_DN3383_c0_g2~~TRINITY_DN3383_c0_g2_i1.p1  ORF type:complete len:130 (+),score=3.97 TRINITY_DN3383_c0_g2_i1:670-1059(+)
MRRIVLFAASQRHKNGVAMQCLMGRQAPQSSSSAQHSVPERHTYFRHSQDFGTELFSALGVVLIGVHVQWQFAQSIPWSLQAARGRFSNNQHAVISALLDLDHDMSWCSARADHRRLRALVSADRCRLY